MVAFLTGMRWNLNVLICISFMTMDVEHFFMCFLAAWTSSLEKVPVSHLPISSLGHVFWGEFSFVTSLYILAINPLSSI
jgi:hypothetical protein